MWICGWSQLIHDMNQWRALVNMVVDFPYKERNCFIYWTDIGASRTLPQWVNYVVAYCRYFGNTQLRYYTIYQYLQCFISVKLLSYFYFYYEQWDKMRSNGSIPVTLENMKLSLTCWTHREIPRKSNIIFHKQEKVWSWWHQKNVRKYYRVCELIFVFLEWENVLFTFSHGRCPCEGGESSQNIFLQN